MKKLIAGAGAIAAAIAGVGSAAVNAGAFVINALDDEPDQPKARPRIKAAGHGVMLAADRLKAHREAQDQRLANAPDAMPTRQQRRQAKRRAGKMPLGMKQSQWHDEKGLPKICSGKRRGVL